MRRPLAIASALALAACSAPGARAHGADLGALSPPPLVESQRPLPTPSSGPIASAAPKSDELPGDAESDGEVAEALTRVARARELPIKKVVHGRHLGREELLVQLKKKMYEEVPEKVVHLQGEEYRALELMPVDYDFETGLLKLLQSQIAGYYDPDDKTMYLLDDLGGSLRDVTLNHELIHALQDQSFDLQPRLKYRPGKGDEESALQTLIEGDATSGMMDAAGTSALAMDDDTIGSLFSISSDIESLGSDTPPFIRDSLVSPYVDGFKFVGALRRRNGWKGVDDAFLRPPTTTEQILHIDKFLAHEPALVVPDPTIDALGSGYGVGYTDTMGELGFRLMFMDKAPRKMAETAAAGWGGDRFVVAENDTGPDDRLYAVGMHLRMDTANDAREIEEMLSYAVVKKSAAGGACRERPELGPIAWQMRGVDAALVAGPYRIEHGKVQSASTCADAAKWLTEVLADKILEDKTKVNP